MKTPFSSVVTPLPPPPNNVAKRFLDVYLFPTLKKGEGEATFHEGREENLHLGKKVGNFYVSQQLLSMIDGQTGTVLSGFYMRTLKTLNEVRVQFLLHHF